MQTHLMDPAGVPGSAVYGGGSVVGTRVILPSDTTTFRGRDSTSKAKRRAEL